MSKTEISYTASLSAAEARAIEKFRTKELRTKSNAMRVLIHRGLAASGVAIEDDPSGIEP